MLTGARATTVPRRTALAAIALGLMAAAVASPRPVGLPVAVAAVAAVTFAVVGRPSGDVPTWVVSMVALTVVALFVAISLVRVTNWMDGTAAALARCLILLDAAAACFLLLSEARRAWLVVLLVVHGTLGVVGLTDLVIDVLMFQETAAIALVEGENPYTATYPDVYHAHGRPDLSEKFYGEGVSVDGLLVYGFPYFPLSALAVVPGHLLGDVRLVHLAAVLLSGWLLATRSRDARLGSAAAVMLMLTPPFLELIANAWTESMLAGLLIGAAALGRSRRYFWGAAAFFKQYMVLFVPLFWLLEPPGRTIRQWIRDLAIGALPFAVLTLPFVFADFDAFFGAIVEYQFRQPFRGDSLSVLVSLVNAFQWPPPWSFPFIMVGCGLGAVGLCLRRLERSVAAFGLALAMTSLWFFLSSKQSFHNYLFITVAGLAIAVAYGGNEVSDPEPVIA